MVGCDAQFRPDAHDPGQAVEDRPPDDPAVAVAAFGPGIGEEDEHAPEAAVGKPVDHAGRLVGVDAHVAQSLPFRGGGEACGAVEVGIRPDDADVRVAGGLPCEVLARPETDLEPGVVGLGAEDGGGLERPVREAECRQYACERVAPAGTEGTAATSAAEPVVLQVRAAFRSSARSVRSQEKPPSASGRRPKCPYALVRL